MMKNNKEISVYKEFRSCFAENSIYSAIVILCICVLYALFSFIISSINISNYVGFVLFIIFLVIIFNFIVGLSNAYSNSCISSIAVENEEKIKFKDKINIFFSSFLLGFQKNRRKVLKITSNIIFTILIYFLVLSITFVLSITYLYNTDLFVHDLFSSLNSSDLENIIYAIEENSSHFLFSFVISNFIAIFLSSWFFLHKIIFGFQKNIINLFLIFVKPNDLNFLFKNIVKANKKEHYLNYYKYVWILFVVFYSLFSLSYFLIFYLSNENVNIFILSLSSIVIGVIFSIPLLPIIFYFYANFYDETRILLYMSVYNKFVKHQDVSFKEEDNLSKSTIEESYKKFLDEYMEDEEENSDDENENK